MYCYVLPSVLRAASRAGAKSHKGVQQQSPPETVTKHESANAQRPGPAVVAVA